MKPRPKYADSDSESESSAGSSSESVSQSEIDSDSDALEELLGADSTDEGESGGPYTATDLRNVVLHLAAFPDERESTLWSKFHEQVSFLLPEERAGLNLEMYVSLRSILKGLTNHGENITAGTIKV